MVTEEQEVSKNIYHLAMEFYRQDEIDDKLQIGRYITFIGLSGHLRVGKIIECKKSDFYTEEFKHYAEFIVECQKFKSEGTSRRTAVLDYIIKEGSRPKNTKIRFVVHEDNSFPLRS